MRLGLQVLTLTNDWVKTADVKAAALLAASGVAAGVLYNLTGGDVMTSAGEQPVPTGLATASLWMAVACSVLVLTAAACAATALVPRFATPSAGRRHRSGSAGGPNLLYFGDVAEYYSDLHGQQRHAAAVLGLLSDAPQLARAVAQQLHVNALIAARKHRWVRRGLRSLLLGLVLLAGTAVLRVLIDSQGAAPVTGG